MLRTDCEPLGIDNGLTPKSMGTAFSQPVNATGCICWLVAKGKPHDNFFLFESGSSLSGATRVTSWKLT